MLGASNSPELYREGSRGACFGGDDEVASSACDPVEATERVSGESVLSTDGEVLASEAMAALLSFPLESKERWRAYAVEMGSASAVASS